MNNYVKDEKLQRLMQDVILKYPEFTKLKDVRIICLAKNRVKTARGKKVYGDCTKVTDKMKPVAQCDFIITFYADGLRLKPEIQERLMYHELLHAGYSKGRCFIVPHDVEDFEAVIRKWGVDWITDKKNK